MIHPRTSSRLQRRIQRAVLDGAGSPSLTNDLVMFGVASWGDWSTPNDIAYDICVDNNNDGVVSRDAALRAYEIPILPA